MDERLQALQREIRQLEKEIATEIAERTSRFKVTFTNGAAVFDEATKRLHARFKTGFFAYLVRSSPAVVLSSPFIYIVFFPAVLFDAFATLYQAVCFPVYGIPKVNRRDYIIVDRHRLRYLNGIEKLNCAYCGYLNGLLGYLSEMAGRTERYWCPIRHARPGRGRHSQESAFLDYGDAEGYRKRLEEIRSRFES